MLKIRTTKAVQTSLHTDETHKLEFQFTYSRTEQGMKVVVDVYAIHDDNDDIILTLIGGAGSTKNYSLEELTPLVNAAKTLVPANDDPLMYFDALVAEGVKLAVVNEGYWKNQFEMSDFES